MIKNKKQPVCTIEITNNIINQIKGKANGVVSPKYIDYCLKVIQHFNYKLNNSDIENIGYSNQIDLNFIKNHFKNYKIVTINNTDYLYAKNKLKLIKKFDCINSEFFLYFAKSNQCFETLKIFVENGVNIQAKDDFALIWASQNGYLEVVKYLVENGANIHVHAKNNEALKRHN